MPQTFYEVVWIFLIYAFIGWCSEVSYAALDLGQFVNRGFLNGPYCPIYGVGVLIVVVILTPLKHNLVVLFVGSVLLTSVLEYGTGFILEKVFHNKWWDYSDYPFNINGYVCLKFSILWGLACTFVMLILHPMVVGFIHLIPHFVGVALLASLLSALGVDFVFTVGTIRNFNRRLRLMGEVAQKLKNISDEIGSNIYENVSEIMEKKEAVESSVQSNLEKKKKEYEALARSYREMAEKNSYGHARLMRAFPGMKSRDHNESLMKIREHIKKLVRKEGFTDDSNN